jgi:chemotaxis protein MotB
MRTRMMVPIFLSLLLFGCVSRTAYNQEVQKYDREAEQTNTLGIQLKDCQEQKKQLQAEVQANQEQIKKLESQEEKQMSALSSQDKICQELTQRLQGEIQADQAEVKNLKDRLAVSLVNQILFPEAGWEIHEQGKAVLKKILPVLMDLKNKEIEVRGHTDNLPIGPSLKHRFPTNWELSTERASEVVRYLQEQGIDPRLLKASGLSEYQPVAPNDTPEGKAKNRRVEILIVPLEG